MESLHNHLYDTCTYFVQIMVKSEIFAMELGKLPVPGRPTIWITVGQGPTALLVGAGGSCLDVFTLIYPFLFSFSLSLGDGPI